ncbi:hypothetical protein JCM16161A_01580 [Vulcanisaeta sp. JCM 16161]|uniref:hypothetical protein n=1 Tax=Vulcanisaeta sp. JCM 16161 TaxID=1295372 RepID=UPI0006D2B5C9|nr:hypothetical protein [Vulcanisaeta sp. JCM 16161]
MSRGFTIGGIVILALLIMASSLIIYLIGDYLYTTYQSSTMTGRINARTMQLSRSCITYLINNTLYFPYGAYVEYSVPNVVRPGYYHTIGLAGINGEAILFLNGCVVIVESTGNATGYEVLGYGTG